MPRRAPLHRRSATSLAAVAGSVLLTLAGCQSGPPAPLPVPEADAAPTTYRMNRDANAQPSAPHVHSTTSRSRPLAYLNGEVVSAHDVMIRIEPQLRTMDDEEAREAEFDRALLRILVERLVDQAAKEARVGVGREELERVRTAQIKEIERRGQFDAFLAEQGMSRQEFDDVLRRRIRSERWMSAAVGLTASAGVPVRARTDPFVKPAEIRAYYDRYPERFRTPQMARVRVLSVRADPRNEDKDAALEAARARAAAALQRLRAGEDWTPVFRDVQRESAEPDPSDGLMELAERGRATPWIEEYAFDQPRGTLSDVVKAGSQFYVLRAEGVRPERIIPFEEAQPLIERELRKARFDAAYYEVCLSLLEESSIRPTELHGKVRTHLRDARRKILEEVGL